MRDVNGHELNTAAIIGALLYGQGDLVETLRLGFNFGWDADCNAATAGTVVGVIKGRKWMDAQGWTIRDVYRNITRPGMPDDETITSYGDRLVAVARKVILANGGKEILRDGKTCFRIAAQPPANVEPLPQPIDRIDQLKAEWLGRLQADLAGDAQARARAAYIALALDEADALARDRPEEWAQAIQALTAYPKVVENLFKAPEPPAKALKARARAAGLQPPGQAER
jgi:hypothetical protein